MILQYMQVLIFPLFYTHVQKTAQLSSPLVEIKIIEEENLFPLIDA